MTCKHCGKPEAEHHEFEANVRPEGCVCDLGTWLPLSPGHICGGFIGETDNAYCAECMHDKACHAGAQEGK
jgi:hypothetical protein